jgi:PQQ-dependent catabolism-associated CXXCW motif protein
MSSSAQIFDRIAEALAEIRPRFGAGGFSDRRRVIGLLADKVPDAKREIRVVGTAIDEGIPQALARTERQLVGVEMDRLANALEASTALRLDIARQVVRSFAFALDLGPPPSIYEAASMPNVAPPPASPVTQPPAPPAAGDGWAGISTPVGQAPASQPVSQYPPHSTPAPPYQPTQPITTPMAFAGQPPKKPNMALRIGLGVAGVILLAYGASQFVGEDGNRIASTGQRGFADELVDQGVSPTGELVSTVAGATPMTISAGQRVSTQELQRMIADNPQLVLVDVLAQPHPQTLQGAVWLPSGGSGGSFNDSYQGDFAAALTQVTGGERSRPLVFFCASANCWESHNATLRANAAGFTRLFWYRGGLASWTEARLPLMPLPGAGGNGQPQPPVEEPPVTPDPNQPVGPEQPQPDPGTSTETEDKPPVE